MNEPDTVKMGVSQGDGDEPKLSLSVKECSDLLKMYNNVFDKVREFVKENS